MPRVYRPSGSEWDRYKLPERMIAPIPSPLDVRRWRPADRQKARRELRLPPNRRIVVWHGWVQIDRKGLDLLLDSWRQVCAARPIGSAYCCSSAQAVTPRYCVNARRTYRTALFNEVPA
jgi:hypothetical protein